MLDAPDLPAAKRIFDRYHKVLKLMLRANGGGDWCWRTAPLMAEAGLVNVQAEAGGARSWYGGETGCRGMARQAAGLRAKLEAATAGLPAGSPAPTVDRRMRMLRLLLRPLVRGSLPKTVQRLQEFETLVADPQVAVMTGLRVSTAGHKAPE